ncbi:hypothetical protein QAD02_006365 [Eretmocerus hayati]|uniref:Uncharacterized protein n=1 Tax=Eretmocerus hayati TaxID=131215 RepID=A0ACC2N0S0_9HYME|nr:hypothetical protein QAD02_006365 [Eretmocerus hayati]
MNINNWTSERKIALLGHIEKLRARFDKFHEIALSDNLCGKHNKLLLKIMGLWPHQPLFIRRLLFFLNEMFAMSVVVPSGLFMVEAWGIDFSFLIGQITGFCFFMSFPICYIIAYSRIPQFKVLLAETTKAWNVLKDEFENEQVMEYSKLGHLLSIGFTIYLFIFWTFCTTLLLLIPFLGISDPYVNHTGPMNVIRLNYIVFEQRDHYYLTSMHLSCFTFAFVVSLAGVSSIFLITIEQIRGFLSVTRLCDLIEDALYPIALESQVFCVAQLALSYYCILEGDVIPYSIKCGICLVIAGIYFFLMIMSWLGQSITNSSEDVFDAICMSDWYLAQPKDRKQLLLIMQRSQDPSILTAGKISNLSLESFVQLLKMSSSYFGAIASFRS